MILKHEDKTYEVLNVFEGKELLEKFPDAKPIDSRGLETSLENYFPVCPTHSGVRAEVLIKLRNLLEKNPTGIWLNNLQYPTKWNVKSPEILDVCYCDRCLKMFEEFIGEPVDGVGGEASELENLALHIDGSYYHEWLEFKAKQIIDIVLDIKKIIAESGKAVKLGMVAIPWKDKEYGAGIQRVVAQEFSKLPDLFDVVSPALLHQSCGKNLAWVKEMVDYFWLLGVHFLPIVELGGLSDAEKEEIIQITSKKPSMGYCEFE